MADWPTIASLATAGGTLVLAVATFSSVRSGQRSTRIAERSTQIAERALLIGLRPVLVALGPEQAAEFLAQYGALAQQAYPAAPYGTVLPFRRVFVVASRR